MLMLLSLAAAAEPSPAAEVSLWRVRSETIEYYWIPEMVGSAGLFVSYFGLRSIGPRDTTGVANPSGLDGAGDPRWNESLQFPSDLFGDPRTLGVVNLPWAAAIGMGVYGGARDSSAAAGAAHGLIVIESVAVSIAITESLKLSISRPRPYTSEAFQEAYPEAYAGEYIQEELEEEGHYAAWKSMPSGHTSTAAASSFSAAMLMMMHDERTRVPALAGATLLTATAGALRVQAGVHHPTDTIVGGLLGAGVGMTTAWMHRSRQPAAEGQAQLDGLSLTSTGDGVGLRLGGRW